MRVLRLGESSKTVALAIQRELSRDHPKALHNEFPLLGQVAQARFAVTALRLKCGSNYMGEKELRLF